MVARSKFYDVFDVNVHELQLDSFNPRIRHGVDQHDCIERISNDQDTFMQLLRDIAAHGLSPEHILISRKEGKWVVRDGNRRVTALKLLTRPELCLPNERLFNLIQRIVKDMPSEPASTINCLACDDEVTILDYLKRKHTGENAGIGQVGWTALLISLFNLHEGIPDQNKRAAQLILWAEEHNINVSNEFPITNLRRALNADALRLLGFEVRDDRLVGTLSENQLYALVAKVINDIANKLVNVARNGEEGSIYATEDAAAYFRRVRDEIGPPIETAEPQPEANKFGGESGGGNQAGSKAGESNSNPTGNGSDGNHASNSKPDENKPDPGAGLRNPSVKPSWDRPCLFGRRRNSLPSFAVPSGETKMQTILGELRQLDPKSTPLAVAMLLRALFERSDESYRQKHHISDKGNLHKNIAASADHMKNNNRLTDEEHEVIMRHTRTEAGMLHIKTLQAYIHKAEFHPNGQALNTTWDEIGCFVKACWI